MDFTLSKQHEMARSLFREFAEKEVKPLAIETDETEVFPRVTVEKMAKGFGKIMDTNAVIKLSEKFENSKFPLHKCVFRFQNSCFRFSYPILAFLIKQLPMELGIF